MDKVPLSDILNRATFGLVPWLEQSRDITNVQVMEYNPAQPNMFSTWEEVSDCKLPDDFKQFYLTMNGLLIQWSLKLQGDVVPVGIVEINPIDSLNSVSLQLNRNDITLEDIDILEDEYDEHMNQKPHFRDKYFEISSDGKYGKVCLVFQNEIQQGDPKVWFLDHSLQWHFLAATFNQYFRMLILNIGIPGWQYLYTDTGLSPESKQWFSYCLPQRLLCKTTADNGKLSTKVNEKEMSIEEHKIDFTTLFKQKSNDKRKLAEHAKQKSQAAAAAALKSKSNTMNRPGVKNTKISSK